MEKIKRATPAQIRNVLELVNHMIQSGVMFIPIPIFNQQDQDEMVKILMDKAEKWNEHVEKQETVV